MAAKDALGSRGDKAAFRATLDPGGKAAFDNLAAALKNSKDVDKQIKASDRISENLNRNISKLSTITDHLSDKISKAETAFRDNFITKGGAIGGIFGALGGFNIGGKIAEQMGNAPDWQKVGVQIASAMIGQGIGSSVGQGISRIILLSLGLLFSKITLALGVLYAAFQVFANWDWFEKQFPKWKELAIGWKDDFVKWSQEELPKWIAMGDEWAKSITNKIKSALGMSPEPIVIEAAASGENSKFVGILLEYEKAIKENRANPNEANKAREEALKKQVDSQRGDDFLRNSQWQVSRLFNSVVDTPEIISTKYKQLSEKVAKLKSEAEALFVKSFNTVKDTTENLQEKASSFLKIL